MRSLLWWGHWVTLWSMLSVLHYLVAPHNFHFIHSFSYCNEPHISISNYTEPQSFKMMYLNELNHQLFRSNDLRFDTQGSELGNYGLHSITQVNDSHTRSM